MPIPTPSKGESQDKFIGRCMSTLKEEFSDRKKRLAVCFDSWRDSKKKHTHYSRPIPILRSFESEGKRYLYGYACLFQVPDDFGTLMTREVVEASEERLRKYPAVHFNHKTSLGQIIWDKEIEGRSTFIDDTGFHVLIGVYDQCDREWGMIQSGNWGFSYGFMPASVGGIGEKCIGEGGAKKCYSAFVKGFLYEVSVVDAPAHMDAVAYTINRMLHGHTGEFMSASQGGTNLVNNKGKGKKMEDAEIKQMLEEAEKRIIETVTNTLEGKKADASITKTIEEMEQRIMEAVDTKVAESSKKTPTAMETTFKTVSDRVAAMDAKLGEMRTMQATLEASGENIEGLKARISELEKQRKAMAENIITSVGKAVEKSVGGINKRLSVIENTPEFRSPAAVNQTQPIERGFGSGFRGMYTSFTRRTE